MRNTSPILIRSGLFGISGAPYYMSNYCANGKNSTNITFRPILWNID